MTPDLLSVRENERIDETNSPQFYILHFTFSSPYRVHASHELNSFLTNFSHSMTKSRDYSLRGSSPPLDPLPPRFVRICVSASMFLMR